MKFLSLAPLALALVSLNGYAAQTVMDDQSELKIPAATSAKVEYFQAPAEHELPDNAFGKLVRQGHSLFVDTKRQAPAYVGNGLNCSNCHLDQGRLPNSAPLWGLTRCTRRIVRKTTRSIPSPSACKAVSSSA